MRNSYSAQLTMFLYLIVPLQFLPVHGYNSHSPKLTVVIIVDQFAHHYLNKLYPYLKHGLRNLLDHGVVYTNAHMPHGLPSTGTGHAALNTGAYPKDHGFIGNSWIDYKTGKKVYCDDDNRVESYVLSPNNDTVTYDFGKSSAQLMVDGLTDQCVMQSSPECMFRSFSISGKSRSAIATASKLGKPLWFDSKSGLFTSSKAYFDVLPDWVKVFNHNHKKDVETPLLWHKMYPKNPHAYNFFDIDNVEGSRFAKSMLNRPLLVPDYSNKKNMYHLFERTPHANQLLLDMSLECIKNNVSRKSKDRLLLWVCLSPLDKLGHEYGPDSLEVIDMIYHLDKQIKKFMRQTIKLVGKNQVVFALTADHGIMRMPEILRSHGLSMAKRIDHAAFLKDLNEYIKQQHAISDLVTHYKGQELVFDHSIMDTLDTDTRNNIMKTISDYLSRCEYIKQTWLLDDLLIKSTTPGSLEDNIKNQLYKGRSGEVIIQLRPYVLSSNWKKGTSHKSPYDYDTHVPLVLFHKGKFEQKYVRERVTTVQLANSLAEMLNVPKPSASTATVLPGLFDPEYQ